MRYSKGRSKNRGVLQKIRGFFVRGHWFFRPLRGQTLERNIRERIDRGVATDTWIQIFPNYSLRHLPHFFSNHCPLLVETRGRSLSQFCFESWWVLKESYDEEIRKLWEENSGPYLN
ncbi:Endonuclease/exonuclease/phosphatase [Gossypium australe]|uniref:Endonuclease/exonuclease/phosphatase n=1 Tax=Gossypium australe TaxID=47621 RepID=A0A5B6W756_9ROSI|nr:Endonuclease/exonuclease/phosphatase [Gossypium australe]